MRGTLTRTSAPISNSFNRIRSNGLCAGLRLAPDCLAASQFAAATCGTTRRMTYAIRDVERAPDFQNAAAEPGRLVEVDFADLLETGDVLGRNLIQIDVAPAGIIFVDRDPVVGSKGWFTCSDVLTAAADRAYQQKSQEMRPRSAILQRPSSDSWSTPQSPPRSSRGVCEPVPVVALEVALRAWAPWPSVR